MDIRIARTKTFSNGTAVTGEVLSTDPNGTLLVFSGTTAYSAVRPNTCSFTATVSASTVTITDNGLGALSGTNVTGTINYYSGDWELTFTGTAPDNTTDITGDYSYGAVGPYQVTDFDTTVATVSSVTKYRGQLPENNIIPGTVTFKVKFDGVTLNYNDNARGRLNGSNLISGFINYVDGSFLLIFYVVPDVSPAQNILCTYKHRDTSNNEYFLKSANDMYNRISISNSTGGSIDVILLDSEDAYTYSFAQSLSVADNDTEVRTINASRFLRVVSFNNSGFYCEFFNE